MTSRSLEEELSRLEARLAEADASLLAAARQAAYRMMDSRLSRQMTNDEVRRRSKRLSKLPIIDRRRVMIMMKESTPRDQRISTALRDCEYLLSTMIDLNEIIAYLDECLLLGLELANDRRLHLLAALPVAAPAKRRRGEVRLVGIYRNMAGRDQAGEKATRAEEKK